MKRERVMGVRKSTRLIEAAQKLELGSQDSIMHLPSEILMNILVRLPVADIMRCKCVCKPLVDLLTTPEFVKSHLSQAVSGLVVLESEAQTKPCKIVEFVENLDLNSDECRWGVVINFNLPFHELKLVTVHSSANGLLFLYELGSRIEIDPILSICNPITRDYIKLPCPKPRTESSSDGSWKYVLDTFGFGVSIFSGQYKVVRIFIEIKLSTPRAQHDQFECQVYTVGTGSWRGIASGRRLKYDGRIGTVLNGSLHWFAFDLKSMTGWISCFDLETEIFTTFSTPPYDPFLHRILSVLGDCLCLCEGGGYEIHIWLMKEYGDHNSWTKDLVIHKVHVTDFLGCLCPIKVFEDGDILIEWWETLLYYSNKNRTIRELNEFGSDCKDKMSAAIYTPSFVSLKTLDMENVISF